MFQKIKKNTLKGFSFIVGALLSHVFCCGGLLFGSAIFGAGAQTIFLSSNDLLIATGVVMLAVGAGVLWWRRKCLHPCECPCVEEHQHEHEHKSFLPKIWNKKMGMAVALYIATGALIMFLSTAFLGHLHDDSKEIRHEISHEHHEIDTKISM